MKQTDLDVILDMVDDIMADVDWTFYTEQDVPVIRSFAVQCYLSADLAKECTVRLLDQGTIIVSEYNCSYIGQSHASRWKQPDPIIKYEDLGTDITHLFEVMQLAFLRISP